jgi:hypothetical protein
VKLANLVLSTMIACSSLTGAHAQEAGSLVAGARVFGLVTHSAEGREIPVPAGVRLHFRNQSTHQVLVTETRYPSDRAADAQPVSDRKPSNYWTGSIPAGNYKVMIRGDGFLPYNAPGQFAILPGSRTRLDFPGLRRKSPKGGALAVSDGDGSSDAESLAAKAAGPISGGTSSDFSSGTYHAQFIRWDQVPATVTRNSIFRVKFTMKNDGTRRWHCHTINQAGVVHPEHIGSPDLSIYRLVYAETWVPVGSMMTFLVEMKAPDHAGQFNLRYKLSEYRTPFNNPTTIRSIQVQ